MAALEAGEKKDPTKWYYVFDEYSLDYMIYNCTGSLSPKELVPEGLLRMKEYDRQNQTFYLQTLETYYRESVIQAELQKSFLFTGQLFWNG